MNKKPQFLRLYKKIVILAVALVMLSGSLQFAKAQEASQSSSGVQVILMPVSDQKTIGAADNVLLQVTVTNTNIYSVKLLKWFIPFGNVDDPVFSVFLDGKQIAYTGKLIKRPAATEQDYVTLEAGESITGVANLSESYDFSFSGSYEVAYEVDSKLLLKSQIDQQSDSLGSSTLASNALSIFVEGRVLPARPEIGVQDVTGLTSFNSCSASRQTALNSARTNASSYANNAVSYFSAKNQGLRYTTWFGSYNLSRYNTVSNNFTSIRNAIDAASMTFDCTCTDSYYAYVYSNSPYTVYLCNAMWTAPMTGTDSKAGVLIHEVSHFTVVANTDDHVYGQSGAKALAISNPAFAVQNADSHEYFAENTPALEIEPTLTLKTPSGNVTDRTPKYTWTKVAGATNYQVQLATNLGIVKYNKYAASGVCGATNCTTTPTTVLGYTSYKWRVRAKVGSAWGAWSPYKTFTVKKPIAQTPSGDITDKTPKYTWTKETGASNYQIQLKQGLSTVYTKTVGSNTCGSVTCSIVPTTTLGYKTYNWRVRAKDSDSGVWGAWTPYRTFNVVAGGVGFNSTFTANKDGWSAVAGTWSIANSNYLQTYGLLGKYASIYYNQNFTKLQYEVRMKRFGCAGCSNALYVRGTPSPITAANEWGNAYWFAYNNDGDFTVWKANNGVYTAKKGWTISPAINKNGWNTLKVIASGSTLKFYINNILVWTGSDSTLTNGKVGIDFYRDSSVGNRLVVDWAKLSTTGFADVLSDEQVEAGQIELEGGSREMAP